MKLGTFTFREVTTSVMNERTNQRTNQQTNKHVRLQYLLAEMISWKANAHEAEQVITLVYRLLGSICSLGGETLNQSINQS